MKKLPPDPDQQNNDRAKWAEVGLTAFQLHVRTEDEDAVSDLLCDLMHFCDRRPEDSPSFNDELECARSHYDAETMS